MLNRPMKGKNAVERFLRNDSIQSRPSSLLLLLLLLLLPVSMSDFVTRTMATRCYPIFHDDDEEKGTAGYDVEKMLTLL